VLKLRLNKGNTFPRIHASISHTIPRRARVWRGRKGGGGRKGAARALMTRRRRARRGGAAGPDPRLACAAAGQRGTAAAPLHVARQRLPAAPRCQARSKGSSGANNICKELFLKIIKKRLKLKNCPSTATQIHLFHDRINMAHWHPPTCR
jgi:hypothetical protein